MTSRSASLPSLRSSLLYAALVLLVALVSFVVTVDRVQAENLGSTDGSIQVSGDRAEMSGTIIRMQGNIRIESGDTKIEADNAVYDSSLGTVEAWGGLTVKKGRDSITGDRLTYDLATSKGTITQGSMQTEFIGAKSEISLKASTIVLDGSTSTLKGATFSTCDQEKPHWQMKASSITLIPGDKVILKGVTFWEFGIPLFYWPSITLPDKVGASLDLPKIGYGRNAGWYVQIPRTYDLGDKGTLRLLFDAYQRAGLEIGVEHSVSIGASPVKIDSAAYLLRSFDGEDYTVKASSSASIPVAGALRVSASGSYQGTISHGDLTSNAIRGSLQATGKVLDTDLTGRYDMRGLTSPEPFVSQTLSASASRRFASGLSVKAGLIGIAKNGYNLASRPSTSYNLDYSAAMAYQIAGVRLGATVERKTTYTDRFYYLDMDKRMTKSEVTASSPPVKIPLAGRLTVQASAGCYLYEQLTGVPRSLQDSRLALQASIPRTTIARAGISGVWYSLESGYNWYESGHEMAYVSPAYGIDISPLAGATVTLWRSTRSVAGYSPLEFDQVSPKDEASARLTWQSGPVTITSTTGINLLTDDPLPLTLSGRYALPSGALRAEAALSYNIETHTPTSLLASVVQSGSDSQYLRGAIRYSLSDHQLERIELEADEEIIGGLRIQTALAYSGTASEWVKGDIAVTKDLHCRSIRLRYDIINKRAWVEYQLNAFPQDPVKLGLGDDGVLLQTSVFSIE